MATAPLWTNRGKYLLLKLLCQEDETNFTTAFNVVLLTAITPAAHEEVNTMADVTEHANSGGYTTGGLALNRNTTDFANGDITEDDTNDRATALAKDLVWTGSGGGINSVTHAALTDNHTTPGSRQIFAIWSLGGSQSVSAGQTLTLQDLGLRIT